MSRAELDDVALQSHAKAGAAIAQGASQQSLIPVTDADGKVIWKISNDDFPADKPFADPCGGQRLPNGNTVIASYAAQGPIKVFEVTREKKIVWKYTGPHRAHEIQILTTNGKPLESPPMK